MEQNYDKINTQNVDYWIIVLYFCNQISRFSFDRANIIIVTVDRLKSIVKHRPCLQQILGVRKKNKSRNTPFLYARRLQLEQSEFDQHFLVVECDFEGTSSMERENEALKKNWSHTLTSFSIKSPQKPLRPWFSIIGLKRHILSAI